MLRWKFNNWKHHREQPRHLVMVKERVEKLHLPRERREEVTANLVGTLLRKRDAEWAKRATTSMTWRRWRMPSRGAGIAGLRNIERHNVRWRTGDLQAKVNRDPVQGEWIPRVRPKMVEQWRSLANPNLWWQMEEVEMDPLHQRPELRAVKEKDIIKKGTCWVRQRNCWNLYGCLWPKRRCTRWLRLVMKY